MNMVRTPAVTSQIGGRSSGGAASSTSWVEICSCGGAGIRAGIGAGIPVGTGAGIRVCAGIGAGISAGVGAGICSGMGAGGCSGICARAVAAPASERPSTASSDL